MIIDDEIIVRKITEDGLTNLGYNVISFEKPDDAIEYYRKKLSSYRFCYNRYDDAFS